MMRHTLNKIDILPDVAMPALRCAFDEIASRRMRQSDSRNRLNAALAELGLEPVSSSGFNRWANYVLKGEVRRPVLPAPAPATGGTVAVQASTVEMILAAADALRADLDGRN